MKAYRLSFSAALAAGGLAAFAAMVWSYILKQSAVQTVSVLCPGAAFTAMLVMGSGNILETLQGWIRRKPARFMIPPLGLWVLYLVYAGLLGVADATSIVKMAAYLGIPFLLLWLSPKLEPAVILWIWLPLESGILRKVLTTAPGADLHYVFAQLLAIDAGIAAFAVWRSTPRIGYRFEWDWKVLRSGSSNFLLLR